MIRPQSIGAQMPHGFAGAYARQPDMIVNTAKLAGDTPAAFGTPLVRDSATAGVKPMGSGSTATQFIGIAGREIKSAVQYLEQDAGAYWPGDAVSVFQRGCINVFCQRGTPAADAPVYVRVTASETYPNAVVGGYEAEADGANSVELTNAIWAGPADANGVAELWILYVGPAGSGAETYTLPAATQQEIGGVKQMAAMADLAAAPTMENFNALLAALRASGMMASE